MRIGLFRRMLPLIYQEFIDSKEIPFDHVENLPIPIQNQNLIKDLYTTIDEIKPDIFGRLKKQNPIFILMPVDHFSIINESMNRSENFSSNCFPEQSWNSYPEDFDRIKSKFENKYQKVKAPNKSSLEIIKEKSFEEITKKYRKISESLPLVVQLLCYNFRNCLYSASQVVAIEMLKNLSFFLDDNLKLVLVCPFLCTYFEDIQSEFNNFNLINCLWVM